MIRLLSVCLALSILATPVVHAQSRKPLLIDGKTELFQRILTRPGAKIAQGVGAPGEKALDPFTPLYVYQRHPVDGGGQTYLEVGPDAKGTVVGFLPEPETVPWRHALVLAFSERVNRGRTLFFRDEAGLRDMLKIKDRAAAATAALAEIDAGTAPTDGPIISVEPETPVDFETKFYMLPVLSAEQTRVDRKRVRIVEIASITADEKEPAPVSRRINPGALKDFRAGVVFVIDASSSMGPYIDRTRAVMRDVLAKVEAEGLRDKVRFGLVAYRDDPEAVTGIEYLTRTFADPNAIATGGEFDKAIEPLTASTVSTRAFAEDSFAAVNSAFTDIEWDGFGARYVILITDASSRAARPESVGGKVIPASDTGLSVAGMNQVVRRNDAALYALHLKSPAGVNDHARAEAQYRALAQFEGQSLYYPVPSGDPAVFADTVGRLADALVAQVKGAEAAVSKPGAAGTIPNNGPLTVEDSAALIGRAMALAYLGREQGQEAPSMFRAFATDSDLVDPDVQAFTVRVLLSKNQLSDLQKTLEFAVTALENGQIDPDDLFNQLRSAASAAGRDPNQIGQGAARNMEESGLIGEYLEGLPYQSRLMGLTEDDWIAMGVGDQQAIIDEAYANIRLYQSFHDDSARWIALNEGAAPGDHVYPVPLEVLP